MRWEVMECPHVAVFCLQKCLPLVLYWVGGRVCVGVDCGGPHLFEVI